MKNSSHIVVEVGQGVDITRSTQDYESRTIQTVILKSRNSSQTIEFD